MHELVLYYSPESGGLRDVQNSHLAAGDCRCGAIMGLNLMPGLRMVLEYLPLELLLGLGLAVGDLTCAVLILQLSVAFK